MKRLYQLTSLFILFMGLVGLSRVYAETNKFVCPLPTEIQLVNLTSPATWIGPPVATSRLGEVGVGVGGQGAGEFIAAEPLTDGNDQGWVCIYRTSVNSLHTYEESIRKTAELVIGSTNPLLKKKCLARLDKEFKRIEETRQPFLKKYAGQSVGFLRYHLKKDLRTPSVIDQPPALK